VRLELIGWLRRLDGDRVEVWHDRLLNWSVAEELVERRKSESLTSQELNEAIAKLWGLSERRSGRYLGYVPLDVLWLIADSVGGLSAELPGLIEAIEKTQGMPHQLDRFYNETLPTLGERAISGIIERVKSAPQGEHNRYPYLAASALVSIALSDNTTGAKCGRELISESDKDLQRVGLRVLAAAPDSSTLDRLWELHQEHCRAKDTDEFRSWYPLYDAGFTALRVAVKQHPDWLETQIEAAPPEDTPVHELAYLLASLEVEAGRRVWQRKKRSCSTKSPLRSKGA
jgi:hypothetical protein